MASIKHYDRKRLHEDLPHRVEFLRDFLNFTKEDEEALHGAAPLVTPLIPTVVDAVYVQLFKYDYTKAVFLKRNEGYTGKLPEDLNGLTLDDEQIKFRKDFLTGWAKKVFTSDYSNPKTWEYLDKVGLMHTGAAAFKHRAGKQPLHVDLLACNALMGWVEDFLITTVLPIPEETVPAKNKLVLLRAINKILWIQQDLFNRHYVRTDEEVAAREQAALKG